MKVNFNLNQIKNIIRGLNLYNSLYVTTEGQMFHAETDAKEAIRTKNMAIDDPNDYIGYIKMTIDDVSLDKLPSYGKATIDEETKEKRYEAFNALFKDATIPPAKDRQKPFERTKASKEKLEKSVDDAIAKALSGEMTDAEIKAAKDAADKAAKDAADKAAKDAADKAAKDAADKAAKDAASKAKLVK